MSPACQLSAGLLRLRKFLVLRLYLLLFHQCLDVGSQCCRIRLFHPGSIVCILRFIIVEHFSVLAAIRFFRIVITGIVIFGFIIFVFDDMTQLGQYIRIMFGMAGVPLVNSTLLWYLRNNFAILIIGCILAFPVYPWLRAKLEKYIERCDCTEANDLAARHPSSAGSIGRGSQDGSIAAERRIATVSTVLTALGYLALFLLTTAYLVNDSYNPFLYFRF